MAEVETARQCAETMRANDRASSMLGISVDVVEAGRARATMTVRDDMVNGFDVCHGGLLFTLADTAFAFACNTYDAMSFAASAQIEFIRPAALGDRLLADAHEDHRGRRSGFYSVRVTNQDGALVALFRGHSVGTGEPVLREAQ